MYMNIKNILFCNLQLYILIATVLLLITITNMMINFFLIDLPNEWNTIF